MELSNTISFTPAIVKVTGAKVAERKISAIAGADACVLQALSGAKGALGKIARHDTIKNGREAIAVACSNNNYRPLATLLAAELGEPVTIDNRDAFKAQQYLFAQRILKEQQVAKNKGVKLDKNGIETDSAKVALYRSLMEFCAACAEYSDKVHAERAAARAARSEQQAIAQS